MTTLTVLAAGEQLPEDVGKSGPLGLLLIVVLLIATVLLVKSMGRHLKKVPRSFDPEDRVEVPDTPAELLDGPAPGEELLDTLRRAPRAIEPPRSERPRSDRPRSDGAAGDPRDR
jgi:hypothetical protein